MLLSRQRTRSYLVHNPRVAHLVLPSRCGFLRREAPRRFLCSETSSDSFHKCNYFFFFPLYSFSFFSFFFFFFFFLFFNFSYLIYFIFFLDASSHLYMRVSPSVGPSVSIKEKRGLGASYVGYPALLSVVLIQKLTSNLRCLLILQAISSSTRVHALSRSALPSSRNSLTSRLVFSGSTHLCYFTHLSV